MSSSETSPATVKPGGTLKLAATRARAAALPPTRVRSSAPGSSNQTISAVVAETRGVRVVIVAGVMARRASRAAVRSGRDATRQLQVRAPAPPGKARATGRQREGDPTHEYRSNRRDRDR